MNKEMISKISTITLFLLSFSPFAIPIKTLLSAQNLTDGETLLSPKSVLELGFFNLGSSRNRFVGVWFKFEPDTVIWVANRDCPLNNTSGTLTLNKRGSIMLYDSTGRTVWSSSSNNSSDANDFSPILQLDDSGNLILKDQTSNRIIWQSFDHPTNTLLAGMKVAKNLRTGFETYLSSWKSRDDPSEGNYRFEMDTGGAPEITIWDRSQIIGRTGIWNGKYFSGLPEMAGYNILNYTFMWDKDKVSYEFEPKSNSTLSLLMLGESGELIRFISYQPHQTWDKLLLARNDNCSQFAKCGPFSICQSYDVQPCSCLSGFEPLTTMEGYLRNTSVGCKRRLPLGCSANSDGFYQIEGVELPYSHNATIDASISVTECKSRCLMNCSCTAYAPLDIMQQGSGCVMWQTVLTDMRKIDGEQVLYVKVSKSELVNAGTNHTIPRANHRISRAATIGIISSSIILVLLISSIVCLLWRKKMRNSNQGKNLKYFERNESLEGTDLPVFDMDMILEATDNFSNTNKLGEGGFGIVYKGQLPCGQEIAVKRLSRESVQGLNEFMNEVLLLAKLQHRNLVRLLGCCIEDNERLLIYEFMANKSLDFYIFDATRRASLNWTMRLEIIIGIVRGLLYLHQDSRLNIIHRDLKAANVLLDEQMNPKISDFGTARLFKREQGVINTETVIGTRGYMPPEYILEGAISVKSDVYSFGVLLLEIISGKKNQGNQNLLAYAWKLWEEGNIIKLLDDVIECSAFATEVMRYVHVGLLCVQECADDRPSMSSVFTMLSSDTLLQDPKNPWVGTKIKGFPSEWSYQHDSSTAVSVDQLTITRIEGR
ncbi:G-type lectin S-receptor-like serine/threonine-protein kinase At4g27290 isoform X1 [Carex rostrata]